MTILEGITVTSEEVEYIMACVRTDNPNSLSNKLQTIAERERVTPMKVLARATRPDQWGVIHQIAHHGSRNVFEWLMRPETMGNEPGMRGMILGAATVRNESALAIAARNNRSQLIAELLMHGYGHKIMDTDHMRFNAMHLAAQHGGRDALDTILQYAVEYNNLPHSYDINATTPSGETVLHIAVRRGDLEMTRMVVSRGVDIEKKDWSGSTALHAAVDKDDGQMVGALMDLGAKVRERNGRGLNTPMLALERMANSLARSEGGTRGVISALTERLTLAELHQLTNQGRGQGRGRGRGGGRGGSGRGSGRGF